MRFPQQGGRRLRFGALMMGVGFALTSAIAMPAQAAEISEAQAIRDRLPDATRTNAVTLSDGTIRTRYTYRGDEIQRQRGRWVANAQERASIDRHVDRLMREGKNVDSSAVDVVPFEVPGKTAFRLVQDKQDKLNDFVVDIYEKPGVDGFGMSFLASYANTEEGGDVGSDAGFNGGTSSNATKKAQGGRTVYFNPDYSSASNVDHWVTQNYEKWQSNSNKRDWAYNSYATFDPANPVSPYTMRMIDATIRAKPFKGYETRVTGGPYDYEPRPQEVCQTVADLGINIGSYASLSVPAVNCYSGQEIHPEANKHSMGTSFYGATVAQVFLDFTFSLQASSTSTTPIYSDYIWMTVEWCSTLDPYCGFDFNREDNLWTDGGWTP